MCANALRSTLPVCMVGVRSSHFELLVDAHDAMMGSSTGRRHGVYHVACWMFQRRSKCDPSSRAMNTTLLAVTNVPRLRRCTPCDRYTIYPTQVALMLHGLSKLRQQTRVGMLSHEPSSRPCASPRVSVSPREREHSRLRHHSLHYMNIAMAPLMLPIMRIHVQVLSYRCASRHDSVDHG